jgi:hypothetical protein
MFKLPIFSPSTALAVSSQMHSSGDINCSHRTNNQLALDKPEGDMLWFVEGSRPMSYDVSGRIHKRKKGPAPDSSMRPIRGIGELADIAVEKFKKEIYREFARRQASLSPDQVQAKLNQRRQDFIKSMSQG